MYRQPKIIVFKDTLKAIIKNVVNDLLFVIAFCFFASIMTEITGIDIKITLSCFLIMGMFFRLFK